MGQLLYRESFDADKLLREHPPVIRHAHKAALFEWAYPATKASGTVDVTRWQELVDEPLNLPETLEAAVFPNYYDYVRVDPSPAAMEWHVNFADPRLFIAYGSPLFAQDEIQVAEHPLLACVREAMVSRKIPAVTRDAQGATPVLVRNVERRLSIQTHPDAAAGRPQGMYGNAFARTPLDIVRQATTRIDPPTFSNIIAMAAPAGGAGEYTDNEIRSIFATAYTGFAAARSETIAAVGNSARTIVHTGFWGCGAFGGNRTIMIVLQALAARAAGVTELVLHTGDATGARQAEESLELAENLAFRCGTPTTLDNLVGRVGMLGLRWGVSDGN